MQLSAALRLVRTIEPEAMRHRDHICSEAATHDLAHCPKMLSQIYAWRVGSNISAKPINRASKWIRSDRDHLDRAARQTPADIRRPSPPADAQADTRRMEQFPSGNLASGTTQREARKLAKE
jgi:hypothetical protein